MPREFDWNDSSNPAVREAEKNEREDYEKGGCDTAESLADGHCDECDADKHDCTCGPKEFTGPWIICPICNGEGKHVNPNIDSQGLTREDFDEDPDFAEDYKRGTYDVPCYTCNVSGKVRQDEWDYKAEQLAEAAADRRLRMAEDGVWESGVGDYRYGY